jgi:hypothetical protein
MSGAESIFEAITGEPLLGFEEANEKILDLLSMVKMVSMLCGLKKSGLCFVSCKAQPYCKHPQAVMLPDEELPVWVREALRNG